MQSKQQGSYFTCEEQQAGFYEQRRTLTAGHDRLKCFAGAYASARKHGDPQVAIHAPLVLQAGAA